MQADDPQRKQTVGMARFHRGKELPSSSECKADSAYAERASALRMYKCASRTCSHKPLFPPLFPNKPPDASQGAQHHHGESPVRSQSRSEERWSSDAANAVKAGAGAPGGCIRPAGAQKGRRHGQHRSGHFDRSSYYLKRALSSGKGHWWQGAVPREGAGHPTRECIADRSSMVLRCTACSA